MHIGNCSKYDVHARRCSWKGLNGQRILPKQVLLEIKQYEFGKHAKFKACVISGVNYQDYVKNCR